MINRITAVVGVDRALLSMIKAVRNYPRVFQLQYGVSSPRDRFKDIVDDTTPSRYIPKQSRSSYVWYVKIGQLMTNMSNIFLLLQSLSESRKDCKELWLGRLDSEVLHAT